METFIYSDLNCASREKDETKIKFYGAFAAALSYIIYFANTNRKGDKLKGSTTLYRGLKMTQKEVNSYKIGTTTHLMGYTSTSMYLSVAKNFALNDSNDDKIPVIFEIDFIGS